MSDNLVSFNFNETRPDTSTFMARARHFFSVTNPMNFFASDDEIREGVQTVKKFKEVAKQTGDGTISISQEERAKITRGVELMNSCTNDVGELVYMPWRVSTFVWINIPIISGMMLSPPTMGYTLFF